MKNTAIVTLSFMFLLVMISSAHAGHKYRSYGDDYTVYESHRTVTHYGGHSSHHSYGHNGYGHHNKHYRSSHHGYGSHHRPSHVYVEKHVYHHEAPVVTHHRTYRTYNRQPTYYPPARNHSSYNSYNGDVVGDTLIGGAFGAAAGAAIGAALGNPGQGAAIGAAVGGFNGISRGIFGRGFLW